MSHVVRLRPPIPVEEREDPIIHITSYGEAASSPPPHMYGGPWAVYQAFDPARDTEEDLRDAALAARSFPCSKTWPRERFLELGRQALDATREHRAAHDGISLREISHQLGWGPLCHGAKPEPSLVDEAAALRAKRGEDLPPLGPRPAVRAEGFNAWAVRSVFDPERFTLEDLDAATAAFNRFRFCCAGEEAAEGIVECALRVLKAAADVRRGGEPLTSEAIHDRYLWGLNAKRRAQQKEAHERHRRQMQAAMHVDDLWTWKGRPTPRQLREEQRIGGSFHSEWRARWESEVLDSYGNTRKSLRGRLRAMPRADKPPAHCYRGPWTVRTVADPAKHSAADIDLAAAALEGYAVRSFARWDADAELRGLARRALDLAHEACVAGPAPEPFDLALQALLGEWPSLLAAARASKDLLEVIDAEAPWSRPKRAKRETAAALRSKRPANDISSPTSEDLRRGRKIPRRESR